MKIDPKDTLLCSAIAAESDKIAADGRLKTFLCGIGNLEAALRLWEFLSDLKRHGQTLPSKILFVGSAGVYPWIHPRFWKGKFGHSFEIQIQEPSKIEKKIHVPEIVPDSLSFENPFQVSDTNEELLISKTNATGSLTIETVSGKVLEYLRENDLGFENMECWGLASVCSRFKIPFGALFALTNGVGPSGSEEWKTNYRVESDRLQKWILSLLV
ncbi:phosphorylase [Leptospira gomenensis]|uniref:Phosphorylase n=1 Tax=Leptospira gomenensis TaxID=2484974 RepID=A0A5F1YSS5_9LEPT|nr:phosphorylase [Leptospira gomenensis]TGK35201.1 phosphorylase [Leptospira gomenensis]TGK37410.1 phosphorylase [Leptospira gomenensis]TGK41062.1 phosphorylase [Leptospira gomenensis]TGK61292.1 phosphorylase [Leptospira gomenensis]